MTISIKGRLDFESIKSHVPWMSGDLVFVDYVDEDIRIGDRFTLEDGSEIELTEIKIQFDTTEPIMMMARGWKCLCRFNGLNLDAIPKVTSWATNFTLKANKI